MFHPQKKGVKTEDISGLALALLSDTCFIDLLFLCEKHGKPNKRMKSRYSRLTKKLVLRANNEQV